MKKILIFIITLLLGNLTYAQLTPMSIGTIDAGDSIVIYFDVKINDPVPNGTTEISTQGSISGGNFVTLVTDDPDTGPLLDSTRTTIFVNHPPTFNAGANANLIVCQNTTLNSLNSLLAVTDIDNGQTLTWSLVTGPANGTANGFNTTALSNGGSITPSGLSYTPANGFSGNNTIVVQVADGSVSAQITINITVNPLPNVTANPALSNVCTGTMVTLNGGGASSYTWTGGIANNTPFAAVSTQTYTVTGTDVNNCSATATAQVNVNSLPIVTASPVTSTVCSGTNVTLSGGGATSYTWTGGIADNTPFAALATSTYTVTGTDGNGCSATATAQVNVNSLPLVTASPATSTVCSGTNVTLSGGGAISYVWSGGITDNTPFAAIATQNYTVTGTDGNGCSATATAQVNVNSLPIVTASPVTSTVCSGDNVTLSGGGATSYLWTGGITDNTPFAAIATTTYTVTGTDGNGCSATATAQVNVNSLPLVTASPATSTVCNGTNVTLSGGGATSYLWTGGIADNTPFPATATTTYTVTGTDGNGCSATATAQVNVNALPVVTANPVTQTVCENSQATIAGGGATTYTWTGGITDNTPFIVTATNTYTVTGTDGNNCSNTATAEVIMNPAPLVSASATPNSTCNQTSVIPNATGPNPVWSGGLTNNIPFIATATTTYTVTGTDGNGCTATSTFTVTVNAASGALAGATSNHSQTHSDDFDINYYNSNCDLIATVDDGNGGNVLGLTTSTVNVDAAAGTHNGQPFVRRWYQITPASSGSADVVLYINQSDFDDYNAVVLPPYLMLPTTGSNSDLNIPNIRITKNDDAGLGNNPIVITPAVNWNGTYWELSFNTPGFSQFRVHGANPGNVPLPVNVISFNGNKLDNADELTWTTGSEVNNAYFNLQHSKNGLDFTTISKVNSKAANGNSAVPLNYKAVNPKPFSGHNYYRLQQVDIDGKMRIHAKVLDLIWGANGNTVSIYPNPVKDLLNIDLYTNESQQIKVKILDMSGRIIKEMQSRSVIGMNNISLDINELSPGVYTIQVYNGEVLTRTSKVSKND